METFTEPRALVANPHYQDQRQKSLAGLNDEMIDEPIIDLVNTLNKLPYCFTLQSCYGHFTYKGQNDPHNLEPLPRTTGIDTVEYRIAYIAFCIEDSDLGRVLLNALREVTAIDPANTRFCSADWFWERQVNSYALQVEPERFKREDKAILEYQEAIRIEEVLNAFFLRLKKLLQKLPR